MEIQYLKKFEGYHVKLILKNNFVYTNVIFKIGEGELIEFKDRSGEMISIDPNFVVMVSKLNGCVR